MVILVVFLIFIAGWEIITYLCRWSRYPVLIKFYVVHLAIRRVRILVPQYHSRSLFKIIWLLNKIHWPT